MGITGLPILPDPDLRYSELCELVTMDILYTEKEDRA